MSIVPEDNDSCVYVSESGNREVVLGDAPGNLAFG